jgi:hypothetical protein
MMLAAALARDFLADPSSWMLVCGAIATAAAQAVLIGGCLPY